MKLRRVLSTTAALATLTAAPLIAGAAPASAAGATTVQCSAIFPYLTGVIIFGPQGQFTANCTQAVHSADPGGEFTNDFAKEYGGALVWDCYEGLPDFPPEWTYGVTVVNPSGNGFIRCVVHFSTPDGPHKPHPTN